MIERATEALSSSIGVLICDDVESIRLLLTAERIAPQHVRTSAELAGTVRILLDRSRRQAGGTELRGLGERMRVG